MRMKFAGLDVPVVEQEQRRKTSFVTPLTFSESLVATTTLYAGDSRNYFLIRKVIVSNNTAVPVNFRVTVNGEVWVPDTSIPAFTVQESDALAGLLIEPEYDIQATGNGLRVAGWGVRVEGGDQWVL